MRYQRFLRKSTYRRYGLFILTIFLSYYSIQAIIGNKTIDASIEEVKQSNEEINQEIAFKSNFYKNYLQGEYAPFFAGHENGQLYTRERIIRVKHRTQEEIEALLPEVEKEIDLTILPPQESWAIFIERRLSPLKDLGLLK